MDFRLGSWMSKERKEEDPHKRKLAHRKQLIPWFTGNKLVSACARRDDHWCQDFIDNNPSVKEMAWGDDYIRALFGPKFITLGGANKARVFNNRRVVDIRPDGYWKPVELDIIFAAEGVGDVMAIEDVGFPCIGGKKSPNFGLAISACKRLIIIRDNDEAGQIYADEMMQMAEEKGVHGQIWTPVEKDPLEMLKKGELKFWIESQLRGVASGNVHSESR